MALRRETLPKGVVQIRPLAKSLGINGAALGQQLDAEAYPGVKKKYGNKGVSRCAYITGKEAAIVRRMHRGLQISRTFNNKVVADTSRKNVATTFLGNLPQTHQLRQQTTLPEAVKMGHQVYFRPSERKKFTEFVQNFRTLREVRKKFALRKGSAESNWSADHILEQLRAGAWKKLPWGEVEIRQPGSAYRLVFVHKDILAIEPSKVEIKDSHKLRELEVMEKNELPETHITLNQAIELASRKKAIQALEKQLLEKPELVLTDSNGKQYAPRELALRMHLKFNPKEAPAHIKGVSKLGLYTDEAPRDGLHLLNKICVLRSQQQRVVNAIQILSNERHSGVAQEAKHALVKLLINSHGPSSPAGQRALESVEQEHSKAQTNSRAQSLGSIDEKRLTYIANAFNHASNAVNDVPQFKKGAEMPDFTPAERRRDVVETYLWNPVEPKYPEEHKPNGNTTKSTSSSKSAKGKPKAKPAAASKAKAKKK